MCLDRQPQSCSEAQPKQPSGGSSSLSVKNSVILFLHFRLLLLFVCVCFFNLRVNNSIYNNSIENPVVLCLNFQVASDPGCAIMQLTKANTLIS